MADTQTTERPTATRQFKPRKIKLDRKIRGTGDLDAGGLRWKPVYNHVLSMAIDNISEDNIAEQLELDPAEVKKLTASKLFKSRLNRLSEQVSTRIVARVSFQMAGDMVKQARDVLNKAAVNAALKLIELSDHGGPKDFVQLNACKDILDRTGLKPVEIHETRERVYSPEEVAHAKGILEETQAIVARLTNKASPYVITDAKAQSSDTDKGSNGAPTEASET